VNFGLSEKQAQALEQLELPGVQYCLYGGAAGGGKSVLGSAWQIARRMKYPMSSGIIIRQTRKDIYSTVMVTFHKVAETLLKEYPQQYKLNEQKDEIQFHNGSIIYLREGRYMPQDPQYDRLKLEVMDAWIEEGTQVDERAFIALRPRIRQVHGGKDAKLLITSNPGQGWVKKRFVKGEDGNDLHLTQPMSFIQAKVHDNPDKEFAVNYAAALSDLDPITKAMYLDGNWDVNLNENPFFWAYNRNTHNTDTTP
jgi:phage terminase large subunit